MLKVSIFQKLKTVINICASRRSPKHMKQKGTELEREIGKSVMMVRDPSASLLMDRPAGTVEKLGLSDIAGTKRCHCFGEQSGRP